MPTRTAAPARPTGDSRIRNILEKVPCVTPAGLEAFAPETSRCRRDHAVARGVIPSGTGSADPPVVAIDDIHADPDPRLEATLDPGLISRRGRVEPSEPGQDAYVRRGAAAQRVQFVATLQE